MVIPAVSTGKIPVYAESADAQGYPPEEGDRKGQNCASPLRMHMIREYLVSIPSVEAEEITWLIGFHLRPAGPMLLDVTSWVTFCDGSLTKTRKSILRRYFPFEFNIPGLMPNLTLRTGFRVKRLEASWAMGLE